MCCKKFLKMVDVPLSMMSLKWSKRSDPNIYTNTTLLDASWYFDLDDDDKKMEAPHLPTTERDKIIKKKSFYHQKSCLYRTKSLKARLEYKRKSLQFTMNIWNSKKKCLVRSQEREKEQEFKIITTNTDHLI